MRQIIPVMAKRVAKKMLRLRKSKGDHAAAEEKFAQTETVHNLNLMLMQQTNESVKPPLQHSYSLKVTSPRAMQQQQKSQVSSFHPNRKETNQATSAIAPTRSKTIGKDRKSVTARFDKESKDAKEQELEIDDQLVLPISTFNPQRKEKSSPLYKSNRPKLPVPSTPMQRRNSFADILRSVTNEIEREESFSRVSSNMPIQIPARYDTTNYMGEEVTNSLTTSMAPS